MRVLGNAAERDVWHGLVSEATHDTLRYVTELIVIEPGCEQSLTGNGESNPAGIDGDPATAPLLSNIGDGTAAAGGVEYEIARIGSHKQATLDNRGGCLHNIDFPFGAILDATNVEPQIRYRKYTEVAQKSHIS